MTLDAFLLRVAFLALPGLLGCKVYRKLRGPTKKKTWEDFVEILLFSVVSYALYGVVLEIISCWTPERPSSATQPGDVLQVRALQALFDSTKSLIWYEIVIASCVGMVLGVIASYAHKYTLLNRFAIWVRASNRLGDEDVWDYFFNDPEMDWILVRDHKLDLMYFGYVRSYSDSEKDRELLLENVDVYDNATAKEIYSTDVLYISRDKHDLTVEMIGGNLAQTDSPGEDSRQAELANGTIRKDSLEKGKG